MNIKALPSVGSAFFVAFVLWSRRFAVPLQKESLWGALGGAFRGCTCLKCTNRARSTPPKLQQQSYVGALETSAPPKGTNRARSAPTELRWCT